MTKMSRKEQKALEEFAKIAGLDVEKLKAMRGDDYPHAGSSAQQEIALNYIRQPQGYVIKVCKECGESFGSNYYHVAFCSDSCRRKDWERHTKVPWNLNGRNQRDIWGGEVPLIISPTTLNNLEFILKQIQEAREAGRVLETQESEEDQEAMNTNESQELEPDQAEIPVSLDFLPVQFDPTLDFQEPEEENPSDSQTSPQSSPSSLDLFELPEAPSFSLHD